MYVASLNIRPLISESELLQFIEHADQWVGVRFPLNYLKGNRVMGMFNRAGKMIGGFALIHNGQLRVLQSLPLSTIESLKERYPANALFEMTALWLDRSERSRRINFVFWLAIYREMSRLQIPYFIYAYSSEKPQLGQIYSIAEPVKIYAGPTLLLPGMRNSEEEIVEVGSVAALHRAWLKQPSFLFKRLIRRRSQYEK